MKVTKIDSGLVYVAWPSEDGTWPSEDGTYFSFTINDGMVPGSVAHLPTEEFWRIFKTNE